MDGCCRPAISLNDAVLGTLSVHTTMAVETGSSQEPSKEQEKDIHLSRTPTTHVDQAHHPSFWRRLFPGYLWPGSRVVPAPPKVHLSISTSTRTFSLSSSDPLKVSLTLTLQPPSPPITLFVKGTIFERNLSYYPMPQDFDFVDVVSGEKFEPGGVCVYYIPDPRQNELSYRNSDLFMTLYPSVPHIVERLVKPRTTDCVPMKSRREYRLDPCPLSRSTSTWWDYGRKWQILKWTSWPFGRPQYANIWGDKGRDRPGPFEIKCVETCLIKVVD
jgi:hypothetical protein